MQLADQSRSFSIRPAERREFTACRMLLPEAFPSSHAPELLVALDLDGDLIGTAAIGWITVGDPAGFPILAHVVPDWRRRGVGRALVEATVDMLRGEAPAVRSACAIDAGSLEAEFCLATGFIVHHRMLHFEGEAEVLEAALSVYRKKLDDAGWIPGGARIVPLSDAPLAEVAHLVCREFNSSPGAILARLLGQAGRPFATERSVVLLLDQAVVGAQLVSLGGDGIPDVEANVVIPTLRRGWANLLLTHEATSIGIANGSRRFRFFCDERVTDTVNLARRCGARLASEELVFVRPVPSV